MTSSSVRYDHVIACAAYIVGVAILTRLFSIFGIFDFILDFIDISAYTVWDFLVMSARLPPELSLAQKSAINLCNVGRLACTVYSFACLFVPIAIVWRGVAKLFDGPTFASAVSPRTSKFVHFVVCLVLMVAVDYYVLGTLHRAVDPNPGGFDYSERWLYLPTFAFLESLACIVVACLATRHSIRIRDWRDPGEFFDAVVAGDAQALIEQLSAGVDPNIVRDEDGATPLHIAARAGEPEVVNTLLAGDAEPQARDHTGATPLHVASAAGNVGAIDALVAQDVDVDARDSEGATPLHHAAANGQVDAVDRLLDLEADPNLQNNAAQSVLDVWTGDGDDASASVARLRNALGVPPPTSGLG